MYSIVEFNEEEKGGLAIGHHKWITPRKKEIFWPPYKNTGSYLRSLRKGEDINKETWHVYGIVRNFYQTDDLDKARCKLAVAELTSDLNTGPEENLQRKRIPQKRLYCSEEEEENETNCSRFPHSPKIVHTKPLEKQFNKEKN